MMRKVMKSGVLAMVLLYILALAGCGQPAATAADTQSMQALSFLGLFDSKADTPEQVGPFKNLGAYGISGLKKSVGVYGSTILFNDINDMDTVLANPKLRQEYKDQYNVELPTYYCYPKYCEEHWDESIGSLSWWNGNFMVINMYNTEKKDGIICFFAIGQPGDGTVDTHADSDKFENKTTLPNGIEVKWLTLEKTRFGVKCTVYSWEKEHFAGVLYVAGEHKDENLKYCELVRRDFFKE
jgi:hypothetical protein